MKKQVIIVLITVLLINFTAQAMEQGLICSSTLDQLPKHELNIIGGFTKRTGKDTLRCINKILNKKIISQDDLYAQYATAKQNNDQKTTNQLQYYNTFIPHMTFETINTIKNNNMRLAEWCLKKFTKGTAFIEIKCIDSAIETGEVDLVKMVFRYCSDDTKSHVANRIVMGAATNGHLSIIKAFLETYKTFIDFDAAIYSA
ncbi:MAG TPA: hypothetical protein VLB80_03295 [Candidatus Babeliales bacterium]|nr:hypothetical protein [Candidatus Babeliales bacterium]